MSFLIRNVCFKHITWQIIKALLPHQLHLVFVYVRNFPDGNSAKTVSAYQHLSSTISSSQHVHEDWRTRQRLQKPMQHTQAVILLIIIILILKTKTKNRQDSPYWIYKCWVRSWSWSLGSRRFWHATLIDHRQRIPKNFVIRRYLERSIQKKFFSNFQSLKKKAQFAKIYCRGICDLYLWSWSHLLVPIVNIVSQDSHRKMSFIQCIWLCWTVYKKYL